MLAELKEQVPVHLDLDHVDLESLTMLSPQGVFRFVDAKSRKEFAVRFGEDSKGLARGRGSDVAFEQFSTRVGIAVQSRTHVLPVRRLDQASASAFAVLVKQEFPNWNAAFHGASITPFLHIRDSVSLFPKLDSRSQALSAAEREKLPETWVQSAAEMWVIFRILAIPDARSQNLLWDGERATVIDLARRHFDFTLGNRWLLPENSEAPIPGDEVDVALFLLSKLTPDFKRNLAEINAEKLRKLAKEADFSLTETELEGILERIKLVLTNQLEEEI